MRIGGGIAFLRIALLALVAACGKQSEPLPAGDLVISVAAAKASDPVEFGEPFALEVQRIWTEDLVPAEWTDAALAPLMVQPAGVELRNEGQRVVETRRFTARAFVADEVIVPPIVLEATPKGGGEVQKTSSLELRLEVKTALPAEESPVEPPPGPLDLPFPWQRTLLIGCAALVLLALVAWLVARLRRRAPRVAPAPVVPAHERALARLAALAAAEPADLEGIQRFYVEASAVVRDYVEERFSVRAPEMTTEEFLASEETAKALAPEHRVLLSEFLGECDLVKFARHVPSREDRQRLLRAADRFVRETSPGAGSPAKEVA